MTRSDWNFRRWFVRALIALDLVLMAWMAYKVADPYLHAGGSPGQTEHKLKLPEYDFAAWEAFPVLEGGRVKPMQTVAIERVREVTGRSKFEDNPAMSVLMSWLFYTPGQASAPVDWDRYPFILCEDRELRAAIFGVDKDDPAAADKVYGKFVAPATLRGSIPFQRLIVEVNKQRTIDAERFQQKLTPMQRKAKSVQDRLGIYEAITVPSALPEARPQGVGEGALLADPIHYVALDRVPNAAWFAIGELRYLSTAREVAPFAPEDVRANENWWAFLRKMRVAIAPKPYLTDEVKQALADLQTAIQAGKADEVLNQLQNTVVGRVKELTPKEIDDRINQQLAGKIGQMSDDEIARLTQQAMGRKMTRDELKQAMRGMMEGELKKEHESEKITAAKQVNDLRNRVKGISKPYVADDPRYNSLYLDYLEARFPNMYNDAVKSQPFPAAQARAVLAAYDALRAGYHAGEPAFQKASQVFFTTVQSISQKVAGDRYPGVDTIDLEQSLNRVEPFKWAWITMLAGALLFAVAMKTDSKAVYTLGFLPLFVSLAFQAYAYYARITISGRPPVSNMFETVVFVSSMAAVFALILEGFYRKKIIILSGAIISTLGLILADQLPTSSGFSDKIGPLQPVLRSNYWLIIHVMTIVASYAAGALAWGIGNVSLVLYWFNSDRRDLLRTMANLSYAAIKIAVLLLGVGTLLGGIWAAESWGRFWGWDPKETWALIALVTYLIPLHARYVGWVKDFGLAVTSVVCFAGIVMSWYGVNFVLAAGLHSYGMGDGGPWTIFLLGTINLFWVLLVCHKRASRELAAAAVE